MKRILAIVVAVVLVATLSFGVSTVVSALDSDPTIVVSSGSTNKGGTKDVTISIKNNPGVASIKLKVEFSSDLSLVPFGSDTYDGKYITEDPHIDGVELFDSEPGNLDVYTEEITDWVKYDVADIKGCVMQPEAVKDNSVTLNWVSPTENITDSNFTFATLRFKVNDDAELGDKNITVACVPGFAFKLVDDAEEKEQDIDFTVENGKIEVTDVIKGDVDGSSVVDSDDAIYLLYHTFNAKKFPVNQTVDFDGSGVVDSDDAIYLLYHTFNAKKFPLH